MAAIDRNRNIKPMYKAKVKVETAGFINSKTPTIKVIMPRANVQPQFSIWFRLPIANTISENPPNKKDNAKE